MKALAFVNSRPGGTRRSTMVACLEAARTLHSVQCLAAYPEGTLSDPACGRVDRDTDRMTMVEIDTLIQLLDGELGGEAEESEIRLARLYLRAYRSGQVEGGVIY